MGSRNGGMKRVNYCNEALFSKQNVKRGPSGMDIFVLILHNCATTKEASLSVLLEEYGQGAMVLIGLFVLSEWIFN